MGQTSYTEESIITKSIYITGNVLFAARQALTELRLLQYLKVSKTENNN